MVGPQRQKFKSPEKDEIYGLLSNHRRRYVLHYLKRNNSSTKLSDLAEQVAAWEQNKSVNELTSAERKRVYTSLQQTHLDRLADAGMITFEGDTIELTDDAKQLEVYLDIVPHGSIPWGIYYVGLSALSLVVIGGIWLDIIPTDTVPTVAFAAVLVLAFLISSVFHVLQNHQYRLDRMEKPP